MCRKWEHIAPHYPFVVSSIQGMFTEFLLCFLVGDGEYGRRQGGGTKNSVRHWIAWLALLVPPLTSSHV